MNMFNLILFSYFVTNQFQIKLTDGMMEGWSHSDGNIRGEQIESSSQINVHGQPPFSFSLTEIHLLIDLLENKINIKNLIFYPLTDLKTIIDFHITDEDYTKIKNRFNSLTIIGEICRMAAKSVVAIICCNCLCGSRGNL
uniref:Uncharacterized protein n=1 Tax=Meloidogyne hapla TaxID=6305 RepID=A0A1I8BW28_MELHA